MSCCNACGVKLLDPVFHCWRCFHDYSDMECSCSDCPTHGGKASSLTPPTRKDFVDCPHCNSRNYLSFYNSRGGTCCDCKAPFRWPDPSRPSWDAIWLSVADVMAQRATCPRLSVGSVAVRDNQILATAYNGAPRGLAHCVDVGCDVRGGHCVRAVHSEQNIVAQAAYRGVSLRGATLYTRHGFCVRCANLLIQAGIAEAVYVKEYSNGTDGALDALRSAGITVRRVEG